MSLVASFVLSFFSRDVLDEIWDLIESVSEGFPTYSRQLMFLYFQLSVSKKIQDYHESGYIEDLIDVHFADSNCYKQRIKEEDSRLEVLHHAGSFTMLCVGIIVGVGILLLEQAVFRVVVPALRKRPGHSIWKSVHLMFFSQVSLQPLYLRSFCHTLWYRIVVILFVQLLSWKMGVFTITIWMLSFRIVKINL